MSESAKEMAPWVRDSHRMVEVGRHLLSSSSPNALLKQGQLQQVAQDHVQSGFEYLQGWRLHNLSGQPIPVSGHPHGKNVFSYV